MIQNLAAQEQVNKIDDNLLNVKMLGWEVPSEMSVKNYVDANGVFHQLVDRVDLGTLTWSLHSGGNGRFSSSPVISDIKKPSTMDILPNAICTKYTVLTQNGMWATDLSLGINTDGTIWTHDTSYTNAAAFKAAMSGVYLYYELATERTFNVDGSEIISRTLSDVIERGFYSPNLLNPTLGTTTQNGVTCTNLGDGTYKLNGTATGNTSFWIVGSTSEFPLHLNGTYKMIGFNNAQGAKSVQAFTEDYSKSIFDLNGPKTLEGDFRVRIYCGKDQTFNNEIVKPMLVDATKYPDVTYDDFTPYVPSNSELRNLKSVTLAAGETSITITDSNIKSDSLIDFYYEVADNTETKSIMYKTIKVTSGSAVLTFTAQTNNVKIKYRIW